MDVRGSAQYLGHALDAAVVLDVLRQASVAPSLAPSLRPRVAQGGADDLVHAARASVVLRGRPRLSYSSARTSAVNNFDRGVDNAAGI